MMNRLNKAIPFLLTAALVCGMVLQPGCEKKKPPPPPPPPAEPPPPPEVSFDSIMQSLKADPRVKAGANLQGITDETFARAAVQFADGFARADADKLRACMLPRAKAVLDSMVNDGSWSELGPRIEEVRIVYAGTRGSVGDAEKAEGIKQMKAMQPGQMRAFEDRLIKMGMDKNEMERFKAQYQLELDADILKAQFDRAGGKSEDGSTPAPAPTDPSAISDAPEMALLIAVQTPTGAELLGWSARKAGESWMFNNASTLNSARAKAADWDSVGMFGFSLGTGKAPVPPKPTKAPEEKKPAGESAPSVSGPSGPSTPAPGGSPDKPADPRPPRDPRKLVPSPGGG